MALTVYETTRFRRDRKRMQKRLKKSHKLDDLVDCLKQGVPLPRRTCNHKLFGSDYWDCHVEGDWVLLYQIKGNVLYLLATGKHSEVFK